MKITTCFISMLLMFGSIYGQTITTNKPSYKVGEAITVNFSGSTDVKDWVGLYAVTSTPSSGSPSIDWQYVDGTRSGSTLVASGSIFFSNGLSEEGSYKACLLAKDGYTVLSTANFTVANAAVGLAAFDANTTFVVPGGKVNFTDKSTNSPTSWLWSFPGGTPSSSTEKNPSVTYSTEGVYDVSLSAYGASGTLQLQKTGFIKVSNQSISASLKVMQFNIWLAGTSVTNGFAYIRDVINEVNPDLVCFSEVTNESGDWTTKMVNELASLGNNYYGAYVAGADVSLISKYPITSFGPLVGDRTVPYTINVNGASVVVCPTHLDYTYYSTYLPRGYACGGSGKYAGWNALSPFAPETNVATIEAQNLASSRDEQIGAFIDYVKNETRPVLLIGDFNEPSCLDWTAKQANLYDHNGVVFEWNTTSTLKKNGFVDAYRKVYPDEVLNPGITWPAIATGKGSTSWAPLSDERDRIDYIFYKGTGVTATEASLVGPKGCYVKNVASTDGNGEDVFEASTLPWPSDHKAVTATINFTFVPTSVSSVKDTQANIRIFPNPTKGIVKVDTNENFDINVFNLQGVTVFSQLNVKPNSEVDLSGLSKGAYLVKLKAEEKELVKKIIIK